MDEPETKIVTASRVVTQAGADTEAMLLFGDRVLATGTSAELLDVAPAAQRWDYPGATVVPGFNDAHQHITLIASESADLDLSGDEIDSPATLRRTLAERSAALPPDAWLIATRYDHVRIGAADRLTRAELDAIIPDRPTIVVNIGTHWGVANSAALARGGLDDSTPDPHGGELGHDSSGHLDGYLSEQALFDFLYAPLATGDPVAPVTPLGAVVDGILDGAQTYLASGVTSVCDAMVGPRELQALQRARARGLGLRVNALLTYPFLPRLADVGLSDGFGDEWLRVGGVKAFADGAVAGRSCAVAEPFEGTDDTGILTMDAAELHDLARAATEARIRLALHANGERAIELVLDALEAADPGPEERIRHRIEHCTLVTPAIIERMRRLDLIAVPFGSYAYFHGDTLIGWYGAERLERMFAHRSLLDAGITVAGSSDYPCGPWEPLLGLQSCVTRTSRGGQPVGLSQRVSLREALALYTVGSATATGEDHVKGRLAPGYLADFTVLGADLMATDPRAIGQIPITATWVGGEPRWEARP